MALYFGLRRAEELQPDSYWKLYDSVKFGIY
jgi:hypothetical protein